MDFNNKTDVIASDFPYKINMEIARQSSAVSFCIRFLKPRRTNRKIAAGISRLLFIGNALAMTSVFILKQRTSLCVKPITPANS